MAARVVAEPLLAKVEDFQASTAADWEEPKMPEERVKVLEASVRADISQAMAVVVVVDITVVEHPITTMVVAAALRTLAAS